MAGPPPSHRPNARPPCGVRRSGVRGRRLALGLSQEGLAERVGVHRTYAGSIERGERNVPLINILRLSAALDVDPAELVGGLKP